VLPPFVSAAWLADHPGVVLADVRWYLDGRSGRDAYEAGHLPGAVFVDVDTDLAGPGAPTDGRHPLPTPEAFASTLGRLGLAPDIPVVAYDDTGGMTAARLVVMLRWLGRPAAVLDGGLAAWEGDLEVGPGPTRPAVDVPAVPWPAARLASAEEVADASRRLAASGRESRGDREHRGDRERRGDGGPAVVLLDARAPERFTGDVALVDARPGHVPGARNAPWDANLDPSTRRLRPPAEQAARFESLGVAEGADVIVSCGSGVSACLNLLALEAIGFSGGRLFAASWSGWTADPARPAALGTG
jgi:thiosulfate/3-mercaptopyruvate sulfurtransferase